MLEVRETTISEIPSLAEILGIANLDKYLLGYIEPQNPDPVRIIVFFDGIIVWLKRFLKLLTKTTFQKIVFLLAVIYVLERI
ncbi:hypothetical protein QF022_003705 [Vogesella perlucida]|nr:hypothetical protein [Vogesella perlucida]